MSAAHTGCVATSAVDDATEVYDSDGIHVAKCAASSRPATSASRLSRDDNARRSARAVANVTGSSTPLAIALRQNATANAGAAAARISGADVETPHTPTTISAMSTGGGRSSARGEAGRGEAGRSGDDTRPTIVSARAPSPTPLRHRPRR